MPAQAALSSSIFGDLSPLPRGPHTLSRPHVRARQRARLLAALVGVVAERGYLKTTITEVVRQAGVSPNVFYEHFDGLEECFVAAYDAFTDVLAERLVAAFLTDADWTETIAGALDAYLGTLDEDPEMARVFLIEFDAVGPAARRQRHDVFVAFADLLRQQHERIRAQDPKLGTLPDSIWLGFVLAVRAVVCELLERPGKPVSPLSAAPDLVTWFLATIYGASRADRASTPLQV